MGAERRGPPNSIQAADQFDRRHAMRFDFDATLVVRPTKDRNRVIHGRIIDLSCGGIRAVIAADLQFGDALELEFKLPYTRAVVRPEAIVRGRTHYQYGLEFALVVAADAENINRTCAVLELLR